MSRFQKQFERGGYCAQHNCVRVAVLASRFVEGYAAQFSSPEDLLLGENMALPEFGKTRRWRTTVVPFVAGDGFECNLVHVEGLVAAGKGPVLLAHRAGVRANIFCAPVQKTVVDALLEDGYDVWLENWRASIDFAPDLWTLDHAAVYDHPIVAPLKQLEIDPGPLMTAFIPAARGVLDDHLKCWFPSYDKPPAAASAGMESVVDLGLSQEWLSPPTVKSKLLAERN
jgi:hypothetical protein